MGVAPPLAADTAVSELESSPPSSGAVVVICSPKGGSGKTVIATNIAVALNRLGRRVCLIDLDLEFGDVGIALDLEPQRSLIDAVTTEVPDDVEDALGFLTTSYRPGLDCILAPIEPHAVHQIPDGLVTDLLALAASTYDVVVVDTGTHLSEHVLAAIDAATALVLVVRPEIPTLKNMRLFLDTLDVRGQSSATRLLVNNSAEARGALANEAVEKALEAPLAAKIPMSSDVVTSVNEGVPIVVKSPSHEVSEAIRRLAADAIGPDPLAEKQASRRSDGARRPIGLTRSPRLRRRST